MCCFALKGHAYGSGLQPEDELFVLFRGRCPRLLWFTPLGCLKATPNQPPEMIASKAALMGTRLSARRNLSINVIRGDNDA